MKTGRPLEQVIEEVIRQAEQKRDFVAPTQALALTRIAGSDAPTLVLDGLPIGPAPLRPLAHAQIADDVGIPKRYYDRMLADAPDLLAQNVNHWFRSAPQDRMIRTLDGQARSFLSSGYRPLDNIDLISAVVPTLQDLECQIVSAEVTETRFYIKATLPTMRMDVPGSKRVGDVVEMGVMVRNSEVGHGSLAVEPFLHFLACLNGAILNDLASRRYHVGKRQGVVDIAAELLSNEAREADDKALWLKIRDVVRAAYTQDVMAKAVAKMTKAIAEPITTDPAKVVEVTAKRFLFGEETRGQILRRLIEGGDLTRYGLMNAVTRASQDEADYETATAMERAGGEILELAPAEWGRLATAAAE